MIQSFNINCWCVLSCCRRLSVCGCCRVFMSTTEIVLTPGCCCSTPVLCANAASSVSSHYSIQYSCTTTHYLLMFDSCRCFKAKLTAIRLLLWKEVQSKACFNSDITDGCGWRCCFAPITMPTSDVTVPFSGGVKLLFESVVMYWNSP